ncbi:hypothetical protein AMEX_G3308 [Astyanax mexicanus]|uniref:Uncharacterized protein n=1 Tax=Astyanax mexicanus TaxID=7994 RepID=A0A8T2M8Z7_ASTMX|nr:hypothetical protein AMEX_G3308 [Astyanax mexicanus]
MSSRCLHAGSRQAAPWGALPKQEPRHHRPPRGDELSGATGPVPQRQASLCEHRGGATLRLTVSTQSHQPSCTVVVLSVQECSHQWRHSWLQKTSVSACLYYVN